MANMWARKPIAVLQAEAMEGEVGALPGEAQLHRTLSLGSLVALGIGAVIGAGIFVLTGHAAAAHAGPAVSLSFVLAGVVCAFAGLCYAEMASTVPVAGSAYTYAYATMGEFVAWVIGWDLILEYAFGATTVAIGWSGYVTSFLRDLGLVIPAEFSSAPLTYNSVAGTLLLTGALVNLPAVFVILVVTVLLVVGIRESAHVNNVIVALKLAIVVLFILAGAWFVKTSNWVTPNNPMGAFIPPNAGPGQFGWSGIVSGAAVVFFAYIGFDAVSTAAQEARNPQRDMPLGMLGSLAICTLLYVLVCVVITGIVPFNQLDVPNPIALGADAIGLGWLSAIIKFGAILGLSSVILVLLLGQPRIFYSMARDGLLPPLRGNRASKVSHALYHHDNHRRCCRNSGGSSADRPCRQARQSRHSLRICRGLPWCSRFADRPPEIHRPFKTPAVFAVAPLGVASAVFLMLSLPSETWLSVVVWFVIGLVIYFLYGRNHSLLGGAKKAWRPGIGNSRRAGSDH